MPRTSSASRGGLRAATARGGLVNAAFLSGAEALVLVQGLLATALLGPDAIGLYGIVTTTAMTIVALRRVGIDEAFVQQAAADEEAEFQRAFTIELALAVLAATAIAALAPLLAAVYDDDRLLPLTLAVAYLPLAFAFQAPQWIFFRRMDFVRLRVLQAIVPLGTVIVTVPLLLAGVGVWALVIGPACGNALAVGAALAVSPYRLRLRPDRVAARRYLRFSWPIAVTAVAALLVAQGQIAVFGLDGGLAAAGWITLAATLTRYVDRADQILATTVYPAIVRVRDRPEVLEETFAKSNRLALMWAFPFGAGVALFSADLVDFVLGEEWRPAVVLIAGLAVATAVQQLGYNWFAFYRARGEPWPQAVESGAFTATFAALAVPGALILGSWGFVAGRMACTLSALAVRRTYLRRLLPDARLGALALRGALPVLVATATVLLVRLAAWGGERPAAQAVAELALWLVVLALATRRLERPLLAELLGYLRAGTSWTAPRWLLPAALWVGAALISGFTMWRYLEPFDEGLLLQAATRITDGQWPYADFGWAYGPGQPLVVALWFKAFGPSVIAWRVVRVIADATIALLVWWFVQRRAPGRWALIAWLAAATTIAQPTSANPFPIALAFALGAVAIAAGGRAPIAAGAVAALALFWRPDLGAVAVLGAAVVFAVAGSWRRAAVAAAAGVGVAALLYLPFAVAAGVPQLWDSLVAEAIRDGSWWTLPFPLDYDGPLRGWPPRALVEDLKDVLGFYLPLIGVVGAVAVAVRARRGIAPAAAGLAVLGLGALAYLRSRPDELHVQPWLVILCALGPLAIARRRTPAAAVLAACLALVLTAGVANRVSALLLAPPLEPVTLAGVPGIRVPPDEARALPAMVARVQRLVPPGEPIYVAPRRSDLVTLTNPLVHFLTRRPNVLRRDVLLQARPAEQARIAAALERARPRAIVRWTDPASARPEPNRRGRPGGSRALDEFLAAEYRLDARFGDYDVLVPR